jgi:membrane protease subunit HflK
MTSFLRAKQTGTNPMPADNQSGGGPWGQRPAGGPQPDLEAILKRSQYRLKQVIASGSGPASSIVFLVAIALAAIVAFYAFTFRVNPDELGVVLYLGKPTRQEPAGLHFRLPYPIEQVLLPRVTRQNIIEIGMRSGESRGSPRGVREVPEESLRILSTFTSSSSGASRMR